MSLIRTASLGGLAVVAAGFGIKTWGDRMASTSGELQHAQTSAKQHKKRKVAVDAVFANRIKRLLRILLPHGAVSGEFAYLTLVLVMLLCRTYFDVALLTISTGIESHIIARDAKKFRQGITRFLMITPIVACCNSLLKYGQTQLAMRFRSNLTRYLISSYMKGFSYYRLSNLDGRIANVDQTLVNDVEKCTRSVADLYSNVSKPLVDTCFFFKKLSNSTGVATPIAMMSYLVVSGSLLTHLRKPTARFTVKEQQLEGEYRFVNSRLITSSEEVAFYGGNEREKEVIESSFSRLMNLIKRSQQFRFAMGVVDKQIAAYLATSLGFSLMYRAFMDPRNVHIANANLSDRVTIYYESGRSMMSLSSALGRLILSGRELTRLAGFTERVTELLDVLDDVNQGRYSRTMVTDAGSATALGLTPNSGVIVENDELISFNDVPLVTPNGDVLVQSLNFTVRRGENTLVAGPNGCGKSSLFRTLGELWPLFGGELQRPSKGNLFYVPQRPYLALGTLRDQVIYPHSVEEMRAAGRTDDDLLEYLRHVQLDYLVDREGWDTVQDWADVLSGGEKQRVAMARLFYHRPAFAILDECTSAVSVDVEGAMYSLCKEWGITLFTVSHRKSLWKYHTKLLFLDGSGGYRFEEISDTTVEWGS